MQTNVEVAFVNQPKQPGWSGSIKTTDGQFFGVKEADLVRFQKGKRYDIEYVEKAKGDKIYRDFVAMAASTTPLPNIDRDYANRDVGKPNGSHYAPTDAKDKFIFVTGVVGRAMGSGKFEPADILQLTQLACASYEEVFNGS